MQIIPLEAVPNQALQVELAGQPCGIEIVQFAYGLFVTLLIGNELVVASVIGENRNRIVRSSYLGFAGDLIFNDTQGSDDPVYTGLGSRFQLIYLEESDLAGGG